MKLRYSASGWEFTTDPALAIEIESFYNIQRHRRLSRQSLETLTVIAYNQPLTRTEIETVRGVQTSGTIQTLLEAELIKIVGQKETLGNPYLYGTTEKFLRHFGLGGIEELPPLEFEREGISPPVLNEPDNVDLVKKGDEGDGDITPVDFGLTDETAEMTADVQQKGA